MNQEKIYEPIRKKIEEWIRYDDHKPAREYYNNKEEHDEYRRWHDRDCVLVGGDLRADTMFGLWLLLRHTIARINDAEAIQAVGNIYSKYDFLRDLMKGDNLEKLLPEHMPITAKLSVLFELGMGRENVLYKMLFTLKYRKYIKSKRVEKIALLLFIMDNINREERGFDESGEKEIFCRRGAALRY